MPGYISYRPQMAGSMVAAGGLSHPVSHLSAAAPPSTTPAFVIPQRQSKKIAIVNPETGEDVTATIVKPSIVPAAPKPVVISPAVTEPQSQQPIPASPTKKITIINPIDNTPVELKPATTTTLEPSLQAAKEATEEQVKPVELDAFEIDDSSIFSGGELSELSGDEELEEEEEEEAFGPKLMKYGQKIDYPRTLIPFVAPQPEGVWRYDRSFLLQFRSICTWKPEMELEKVQKARVAHAAEGGYGRGDRRSGGDRRRQRGPVINSDGTPAVLTNRAANAWARLGEKVLPEEEKVIRDVKGMLNKLTFDKFDLISDKIIGMGIMTKSVMPGTIDLIFDKAVEEPKFASMYARLCLKIVLKEKEDKKAANPEVEKVDLEFRRFLISKCQVEYEKKKAWSYSRLSKLQEQAATVAAAQGEGGDNPETPATTQDTPVVARQIGESGELTEEDYALIKVKRRVLGNMRFIGELFNAGLIGEKIMHAVIAELLRDIQNPEEEEIESFCKLFTCVGPKLDIPLAAKQIESYLARMTLLTQNTILSTRVRFMVLDVLDLRRKKWAGLEKDLPKTLADFERELAEKQAAAARSGSRNRSDKSDRSDHHHHRDRHAPARPGSTLHYSTGANSSQSSLSSREEHHGRRTSGSTGGVAGAAAGSGVPKHHQHQQQQSRRDGGFTTVGGSSGVNRSSPAFLQRPSSTSNNGPNLPSNPSTSTSSTALNRYDILLGDHEEPTTPTKEEEQEQQPEKSGEELKAALSQIKSAFNELIRYKKSDDFLEVWNEAIPKGNLPDALAFLINLALEEGEKAIDCLTGQVFTIVSFVPVTAPVLKECLTPVEDLAIDLPKAYEFAGRIIAAAIDTSQMEGSQLPRILGDLPASVVSRIAMFSLAHVQHPEARASPYFRTVMTSSEDAIDAMTKAALKTRPSILPHLPSKAQSMVIKRKLGQLDRSYDGFLQASRQFVVDELSDQLAALDQAMLLAAFSSAALERLAQETPTLKQASDLESVKLPSFLSCLSLFDTTALPLLVTLTTEFSSSSSQDGDWMKRVFKAIHACGLATKEDYVKWIEATNAAPDSDLVTWINTI